MTTMDNYDHASDALHTSLRGAIEAVVLVVDSPISADDLADVVDSDADTVTQILHQWADELTAAQSGIDLREMPEGWRLYTRADYAPYVEKVLLEGARGTLSRQALETLAVVAYRQPVTRSQVSAVRGVNVDGVMRTLQARGLIVDNGRDPETGGMLFCTTSLFLEELGLTTLTALPDLAPLLPAVERIDEIDDEVRQTVEARRVKTTSSDSEPAAAGDPTKSAEPGQEDADTTAQ
ncbi:Segregation and condensation protein B [Lawsonella clevelandensis]|uniref:Segregation and condensation protein B n=2 Tax=Lawsonella clevelandensis TaxID=1528099 RepID=A0A5E3ZZ39_9ACTN|nr:Segregation and condensation protein B [Lawsonella clevelandensis]